MLNKQQIQDFQQNGFIVLDQLIGPQWLARLKAQAADIVDHWQGDEGNVFTTSRESHNRDAFFLESAEKISCFFEEEAFDKDGNLVQARDLCINKIGHAMHELDPVFSEFSHQAILGELATDIGMLDPQIRQSMYIFKQPNIGGVVRWHQDATFFYTTPQSVITFWFAIEDATLENGCLWVEPGGHKSPLRELFELKDGETEITTLDNTPWPTEEQAQSVEVKAGSLVLFQGLLPHYSAPNRSSKSRQAYTLHVTDGTAKYADANWLQAKTLPLRGFG